MLYIRGGGMVIDLSVIKNNQCQENVVYFEEKV